MTYSTTHCALGLMALIGLGGCASSYTITDSVSLYPANAAAQQWGALNFYSQYQSKHAPQRISIMRDGKPLMQGQITYLDSEAVINAEKDSFWNNFHLGVGVGQHIGSHGAIALGFSPTSSSRIRKTNQQVQINASGTEVSMNCQGDFNYRQRVGTVACELTNGMRYSGVIRRAVTDAIATNTAPASMP